MSSSSTQQEIPAQLLRDLSPTEMQQVKYWWEQIAENIQNELAQLWDHRQDSCAFASEKNEVGRTEWHSLPVITGRFVRKGVKDKKSEWYAEQVEYLLSRPEVYVLQIIPRRPLGICTRHPVARDTLTQGVISADFTCPFASPECPMRKILDCAPGNDLHLGFQQIFQS